MVNNFFTNLLILILHFQLKKAVILPRHIDHSQFNIFWFMIEPFNSGNLNTDVSVKDLAFCRVVKPCTTKSEDPAPCEPRDGENWKRHEKLRRQNACDCQKVMEKNKKSFLEWVEEKEKMTIATVNFSENLVKFEAEKNCNSEKLFKRPKKKEMTRLAYHKHGNRLTNKYKIKKSQTQQVKRDVNILGIPVFEIFNPEPKIVFNDVQKGDVKKSGWDFADDRFRVNTRNSVTILADDSEGAGRDNLVHEAGQKCPEKTGKQNYLANEPQKENLNSWSLYKMVKNIFNQLVSIKNPNGYVAIINGGRLEDLKDGHSSLARSISYVKCRTTENDTLIVLSMLCPEEKYIDENGKTADNMLPVFCSGPHCKDLEEAEELKDLFDIIKRSLEERGRENKSEEDKELAGSESRLARALIETTYYDENDQREIANQKNRMKRNIREGMNWNETGRNSTVDVSLLKNRVKHETLNCTKVRLYNVPIIQTRSGDNNKNNNNNKDNKTSNKNKPQKNCGEIFFDSFKLCFLIIFVVIF